MNYRVNIAAEAEARILEQVEYIAVEKAEPQNAALWLAQVKDAIASLEFMPTRCPVAPENQFSSATIRMLRVYQHLILFAIDDDAKCVNVLSFRSGRQLPEEGLGD